MLNESRSYISMVLQQFNTLRRVQALTRIMHLEQLVQERWESTLQDKAVTKSSSCAATWHSFLFWLYRPCSGICSVCSLLVLHK